LWIAVEYFVEAFVRRALFLNANIAADEIDCDVRAVADGDDVGIYNQNPLARNALQFLMIPGRARRIGFSLVVCRQTVKVAAAYGDLSLESL
jgi:hypothetical protein